MATPRFDAVLDAVREGAYALAELTYLAHVLDEKISNPKRGPGRPAGTANKPKAAETKGEPAEG